MDPIEVGTLMPRLFAASAQVGAICYKGFFLMFRS